MGDCLRACVASIFELPIEQVPHFAAAEPNWFNAIQRWLRPMGLVLDTEHHPPTDQPPRWTMGWWIASVESENFPGQTHAVVMRGTMTEYGDGDAASWMDVAHDPSPNPRRTPYVFRGAYWFVALNPAAIARRAVTS